MVLFHSQTRRHMIKNDIPHKPASYFYGINHFLISTEVSEQQQAKQMFITLWGNMKYVTQTTVNKELLAEDDVTPLWGVFRSCDCLIFCIEKCKPLKMLRQLH